MVNRIKVGLEMIKKKVAKVPEVPPTAPPRQDMYEVIIDNGATESNETNNKETVDNVPDSNGQSSPQHQTETMNGNKSNPTPANAKTVEKDMSVAEVFKLLSSQNTQNKEEIKAETKAIKQT